MSRKLFLIFLVLAGCSRTNLPSEPEEIESQEVEIGVEVIQPDFGIEDPLELNDHPWIGAIDASVTIVEFSDFDCSYCSRGSGRMYEILEAYPTEVRVVFKQMPLETNTLANLAAQASLAAYAQGNDFFWYYHDLLFANRHALERSDLEGYAEQIGLDMDAFRAALNNESFVTTIEADITLAEQLGITATPHFLVNGIGIRGAQSFATFQNAIDAELENIQVMLDENISVGEIFVMRVEENLQIITP